MRKTCFEGKRENCINEARRSCEGNRQYGCFVKSKSLTISLISRVSQLRFRSSSRIIPLSHKPRNVSLPFVSRKIYGTRGNERKIEIEFKVFLNCNCLFFSSPFFLPAAIIIATRQLAAASNFFSWANVMARQLREKPLPTVRIAIDRSPTRLLLTRASYHFFLLINRPGKN